MSIETSALTAPAESAVSAPSPLYVAWRRRHARENLVVRGLQVLLVLAVVVLWEAVARAHWVNPMLTSYPSAIWHTFLVMLTEGSLAANLGITLLEVAVSFAVAMLLGLLIAVLLWLSPRTQRVLDPFLVVANALPKIALVPIFYIWLGPELSIYGIAVTISVFIVALMLFTGFRQTDPNKVKLARSFGAGRTQILAKVVLPGSLPTLIAALKANAALTLVGVIVGEFQSGKAGLGYMIVYGSQVFQMDRVMVSVVILGLISLAMYMAIQAMERLLTGSRG